MLYVYSIRDKSSPLFVTPVECPEGQTDVPVFPFFVLNYSSENTSHTATFGLYSYETRRREKFRMATSHRNTFRRNLMWQMSTLTRDRKNRDVTADKREIFRKIKRCSSALSVWDMRVDNLPITFFFFHISEWIESDFNSFISNDIVMLTYYFNTFMFISKLQKVWLYS